MSKFKKLSRIEMKAVLGGLVDPGGPGGPALPGGPGGNNGNPCPEFCEPVGGQIICVGTYQGVNYIYDTNCNNVPHSGLKGLHNRCLNDATGDFWC